MPGPAWSCRRPRSPASTTRSPARSRPASRRPSRSIACGVSTWIEAGDPVTAGPASRAAAVRRSAASACQRGPARDRTAAPPTGGRSPGPARSSRPVPAPPGPPAAPRPAGPHGRRTTAPRCSPAPPPARGTRPPICSLQPRPAGRHLAVRGARLPAGRHLTTLATTTESRAEPRTGEQPVQQRPAAADERPPQPVLLRPGTLAHQHQPHRTGHPRTSPGTAQVRVSASGHPVHARMPSASRAQAAEAGPGARVLTGRGPGPAARAGPG